MGVLRIITGKAKIIGVWEIDKILTVTKNFDYPEWREKMDWSIYGGWVNAYEPVNKGLLASTQE